MPITLLLSFVMVPIYLSYISVDQYGYWMTCLEMANFAGLFWSSFELYLIQNVSANLNDEELQKKTLSNAAATVSSWVVITLGLTAFTMLLFPSYLEKIRFAEFSGLLSLVLIWLVLKSHRHLLSCFMMGQNRMFLANLYYLITLCGFQVFPWLYLKAGFGLLAFGYGYLTSFALVLVLELFSVGPLFFKGLSLRHLSQASLKEAAVFSIQTFTSKLSRHLYGYINILLIAWGLGTVQVVIYSLTLKLTNFAKFIVPRVVAVGYPSFSRLLAEGNQERMAVVLLKLFRFSLRFGLLFSLVILALNQIFITHWLGADKFAGVYFTMLAALFCLKESVVSVFYQTVFATKEIKRANQIIIAESLVNVALVLIFMRIWGITGVLLATLLATGFASPLYLVFKSLKLTSAQVSQLVGSISIVLIKSLPSYGLLYFAQGKLAADFSWINLFLWLALVGFMNLAFFEGLLVWKLKGLKPKEMIKEIIEQS